MRKGIIATATILVSSLGNQAIASPPAWNNAHKHHPEKPYFHPQAHVVHVGKKPSRNRHYVSPRRHYNASWYRFAYAGQNLPHDLRLNRYYLPKHAQIRRPVNGVTELVIAHQIIRILDATHTIISVSR